MFQHKYHTAVVDIGSPKLGNLGWCCLSTDHKTGTDLDILAKTMAKSLHSHAFVLGLEAPLFTPLRSDIMLATKGRLGEGRRPWSGGAGAQVLSLNLPIMFYLFKAILNAFPSAKFIINAQDFTASSGEILIFEALVSGVDKGLSHVEDAVIMAKYCAGYAHSKKLPPTILQEESETEYFNLATAALLRLGVDIDLKKLATPSPIFKPSDKTL